MIKITALGLLATLLMIGCGETPPPPAQIEFACAIGEETTFRVRGTDAKVSIKALPVGATRTFRVWMWDDWNKYSYTDHSMALHEVCGVWDGQQVVE